MELRNNTPRKIVIEPGEGLEVLRSEIRLDADRELKYISIDRVDGEPICRSTVDNMGEEPAPDEPATPSYGSGEFGRQAATDGAGGTASEMVERSSILNPGGENDQPGLDDDASRTIDVCPACDSSQCYERSTLTPPWRCNDCGNEFDEPDERAARPGTRPSEEP